VIDSDQSIAIGVARATDLSNCLNDRILRIVRSMQIKRRNVVTLVIAESDGLALLEYIKRL